MNEKFDAFDKAYETMDPQAQGAADIMANWMLIGIVFTGLYVGKAIKCAVSIVKMVRSNRRFDKESKCQEVK